MGHDSRYEKECPQHGWHLDEDGCEKCEQINDMARRELRAVWQKIRAALMRYSAECWEIAASLPKDIGPYEPTLSTPETAVKVVGVRSPADMGNENTSGVGGRSTQEHP